MDIPADLLIRVDDIRRAGYCATGIRRWFEVQDLDFREFLKNGILATALCASGDAMAERVVALKLGLPTDG